MFDNKIMKMNKLRFVLVLLFATLALSANAQFRQDRSNYEYMFKAELGYMPYMANIGHADENGWRMADMQHIAGVNIMNGVCLFQDYFVGLGLGYGYVAPFKDFGNGWHSALAFVDMDYRTLDAEFSPMVSAKVGAHYMMTDGPHDNCLSPYVELSGGLNWYFRYVIRNMERNYASLYLTMGFAYTQQAAYFPIRLGMRF